MRYVLLSLLFCLVTPLKIAWSANLAGELAKAGEITEIRLNRKGCLGMCPDDELILQADGTASYAGYAVSGAESKSGVYHGVIDTQEFNECAAYFVEQDFFHKDVEIIGPRGPDEAPIRYITVVRDGKATTKELVSEVSPTWWAMETLIQAIAAKVKWQPEDSGLRGRLITALNPAGTFGTEFRASNAFIYTRYKKDANPPANSSLLESMSNSSFLCHPDKEGKFTISLPPGSYSLMVQSPTYGGHPEQKREELVKVQPRHFADVVISLK